MTKEKTAKTQKQLQALKVTELQQKAKQLGAKEISGMKKQELIKLIYELRAKSKKKIYAEGVLEILPDGYGFLRSRDYNYLAMNTQRKKVSIWVTTLR